MRVLKIIAVLHVTVLMTVTASAQMRLVSREAVDAVSNPGLSADSSSVEFDTYHIIAPPMNEDDSPRTFIYTFRNVSENTIDIVRLISTCSCASATCIVKSVAPGASAQIEVRYNPKGHPGKFERKVFVYTQKDNTKPAAVLKLTVEVSNGADYSSQWPIQMGGIRLRRTEVDFIQGQKSVETISFINLTGKTLKIECEEMFLPECLSFSSEPVGHEEEGVMTLAYDPTKPGARDNVKLILKGLGLPPSQSTVLIKMK